MCNKNIKDKTIHINIKICCNNMIQAIKTKIVIINEAEFCLGNSEYKLKESTKKFDTAIVRLLYCPWCGNILKEIINKIKEETVNGGMKSAKTYH